MEEYYETSVDPNKLWSLLKEAVGRQGCDESVIEAFQLLDREKRENEEYVKQQAEAARKRQEEYKKSQEKEKNLDQKANWVVQSSYFYHAKGRGKTIEKALEELKLSTAKVREFYSNCLSMPILTNSRFTIMTSMESELTDSQKEEYKKYRADCERGYVILKYPEGTNIEELPKLNRK